MLSKVLLLLLLCLVLVPTSEQDTAADSAADTPPGGDADSAPGDVTQPTPGDVTESTPSDVTEPTPGDVTEPGPGNVTEPGPGNVTEPAPGDATEPTPGDVTSTTAETPSDSTTEPSGMESTTAEGSTGGSTVNPAINRICPNNQLMNDRIRNNALRAHNYRRSRLAQGLVTNKAGKTLPMASNMHRLAYNCSLEESAMTAASSCSSGDELGLSSDIQENAHAVLKHAARYRKDALIKAVKAWWSQIRKTGGIGRGVTFTSFNRNTKTEWFTRMAWATTKFFGCGVADCGNKWFAVCHYSP
ncbi:SCP domain-containing protein, partial [Trichostrongylus colubriformis]